MKVGGIEGWTMEQTIPQTKTQMGQVIIIIVFLQIKTIFLKDKLWERQQIGNNRTTSRSMRIHSPKNKSTVLTI